MRRLTPPQRLILILCLVTSVGRFALDSYLPSLPAIEKYVTIPVKPKMIWRNYKTILMHRPFLLINELGLTYSSYILSTLGLIAMGCFLCLPETEAIVAMDLASC